VVARSSAQDWPEQQQFEAEPVQGVSVERVVVYYYRHDGYGHQFGLHVWEDVAGQTPWEAPLPAVAASNGWVSYEVALAPGAKILSFIVHRGQEECTKVLSYDVTVDAAAAAAAAAGALTKKLWVVSGSADIFTAAPDVRSMPTGVVDLTKARAVWLAKDIIAVPFGDNRVHATTQFELVASPTAGLQLDAQGGVTSCNGNGWGGDDGPVRYIRLEPPGECAVGDPSGCTPGEFDGGWSRDDARAAGDKYPHIRAAGYTCLRVPAECVDDIPALLKVGLYKFANSVAP
jgi:hypothetical protein